MKPFLIIQLRPEDAASNSEYRSFLKKSGLVESDTVRIRAEKAGLPDINLSDYSAIIVGGSPFDITTPQDQKSDIQLRIESDFNKLFDKVVSHDFPFIGACSGNGLLGNYCGATISKKYTEPVGGVDISLTEEGKLDPLLEGVSSVFRALVGHKEACDETPPGAVLLASSSTCPIQMFRVGENVYATQFHPEADAEEFMLRISIYKNSGYFPPEDAQKLIDTVKEEVIIEPAKILKNFVKKYRR